MIIINESYLLANIVRDNCKLVDIEIFSTKGLLNYYKIKNNKIDIFPRNDAKNTIKYLKSLKDSDQDIVIATDMDSTGELIALEVLNLIPNAKRLNIPFDNLLNYKRLSPNTINLYVKNQYNIELAKLYLKEICHDIDIYEKRNNAFAKILQENITEIKIPKDLL